MIAVDVPSGVDVDTGDVPGAALRADVTVAFGCLKPAHVVGPAVPYAGQVELVDIGLEPYLAGGPALMVADAADVAQWWPTPGPESDKYSRGVVGLATGSDAYPGAALLSVAGAVAGPAGLIRYAGSAYPLVAERFPERRGDAAGGRCLACAGLGLRMRAGHRHGVTGRIAFGAGFSGTRHSRCRCDNDACRRDDVGCAARA